jgi:2-phosphoglycerate kinase
MFVRFQQWRNLPIIGIISWRKGMKISDSVLKAHLQNVLWIGGGGYGGKTTIADLLARKHGFQAYHPEDLVDAHKQVASPEDHPALLAPFQGWEWFFNRPIDEYIQGIEAGGREQFEMVVLDLIRQHGQSPVVVEGVLLDPWLLKRLTLHHKAIFLFADEETIRKGFYARADKQDLLEVIQTLNDPAHTREHVLQMVCQHAAQKRSAAEAEGFTVLVRTGETSLPETLATVEKHFGLIPSLRTMDA